MARGLGRVLVGGKDCGAGFALGPRLAVTAHHVVRGRGDKPVVYVPASGEPAEVERVQPDLDHDAAILWLAADAGESLPASAAVRGATWRVESPPLGGNDPHLHGAVTVARMMIHNAQGQPVEVVQLEVDEQLGGFGGYSGSAVLDSLGRAVLALLVEQKPLRIPVTALGERQAASNVLYAVPIKDVITACGLPVRAARPVRFDVGLLPPGMVTRADLLDEAVGRVIGSAGPDGAGLVLLRGPGGLGKTVLARQVAEDVRVWAEFADGVVMLRAGPSATADVLASQLQDALGGRDRPLTDVLDGQRLLLIADDVWDHELLATLRASLPPTVTVLATTRGVSVPGAAAVPVGAVGREEAIQILARDTARRGELDQALADLAQTLFRWPLLLTLAAAEIHRDDELGWGPDDEQDARPGGTEPGVLLGRARILRETFPDDPTMLDELERTAEGAPSRSVEVLVHRSLDWLGPEHQARFELLGLYPPGAAITQPMLEDLWEITPNAARKEIRLLVRAGLAQPVRTSRPTIELHDLITAWLHHEHGLPGDARHRPVHQRLAGLCLLPDGSPGTLTRDRADWLAHHLLAAGAWDRLAALPTLSWRSAFLVATGSDAAFLAALDQYGHAARAQAPDAIYHAVRAWLFAAHVRALIGAIPIRMLVAMAVVGDPIAGIMQAGQHLSAEQAIPAVLAAVTGRVDTRLLLERAAMVAEAIPGDYGRSGALAGIVGWLAGAAGADPGLADRALAVAETISNDWQRGEALVGMTEWLAGAATADPALLDRALAMAEAIPDDRERGRVLAGMAERLAGAATADPALVDRALAVAETIPVVSQHGDALTRIAERLAGAAAADPALFDRALAVAGTIFADWQRAWAQVAIAERLAVIDRSRAVALIEQALAAAEAIASDSERSEVLARIAGQLAGMAAGDPVLVDRALAVAETIPVGRARCEALAAMAQRLAVIDRSRAVALIEQALAVAEAIGSHWERGEALADMAKQLAGEAFPDPALLDRAVTVAETFTDSRDRGRALAVIIQWLAGAAPADPALVDRALVAAGTIRDNPRRDEALIVIAGWLAGAAAADPALVDRAVAVAETIIVSRDRGRALAVIAGRLAGAAATDPALLDRALAVAETITDRQQRGEALAAIAERLAVIDRSRAVALIDQALAAAETITHDWERNLALAGIAERLAGAAAADPALVDRALAVAEAITDGGRRSGALAAIAGHLAVIDRARAEALIEQALAVAGTGLVGWERNHALAGIAERLAGAAAADPALVDRALAVAGTIPADLRSPALAGIAERLAGAAAADPALVDRALAIAETITVGRERSEALAGIAEQLASPAPANPALIEQALAVTRSIPHDPQRGRALAGIAAHLAVIDRTQAAALIEEALALARAIRDGGDRREALDGIAERLACAASTDPVMVEQVLAVAESIDDDWESNKTLARIAERLAGAAPADPAIIERALAVARTIRYVYERDSTVARIHAVTTSGMLDELSAWRHRPVGASTDLLNVFLGNCHDKTIAERIGRAVADVVRDFPAEM